MIRVYQRLNPAVRLLLDVPSGVSLIEPEMLTPPNNFCSMGAHRRQIVAGNDD